MVWGSVDRREGYLIGCIVATGTEPHKVVMVTCGKGRGGLKYYTKNNMEDG